MAKADTEPVGMSPLQAIILEQMRRMGWDPVDVEARGVSHATLHRYMNPLVLKQLPREKTLRQLATALTLSYDQLVEAALRTVEANTVSGGSVSVHGPVGRSGQAEPYAEDNPEQMVRDLPLDVLLAEIARRAQENNPGRT